ncbi:MAG: insulinase family protein, partial [Deltaproteobacteria bacterium]|nr:insulinase family protein [Deltaproteobacteria bacterium]
SLSSRLGQRIRTEEGRAYGVWSQYGFGPERGLFYAAAQTEGGQTKEVVEGVGEIIRKMTTNPEISDEELERAKRAILSSFYFVYETPFGLVKDLAKFYLWGYPENYLETFQREVSSLTREEIERVCREHLHPEGLKIVIVADPAVLDGLKSLGKFKAVKR